MASSKTDEYHYDKQTLLSEHELLLARTQNNAIDSSMQTTELQSSKLIELNSLKAIKISDLAPGNSYDNKLIYSTQITPVAVAEAVCFVIEDECGNVCRASVPCIVRTVHLVTGAKLAFSNPIYRMAFDGRYSLIVHNTCNVSLLPLVVVQQKYEETYSVNLNSSMHRISTTNSKNSDNTNQEDSTNLDMNTEIETNQPASLIPTENNETNLPSLQNKPVNSLNQQLNQEQQDQQYQQVQQNQQEQQDQQNQQEQQDQQRESNSDTASIYIGQSTRKVGLEISQIGNKLFKEGRYLQAIIQYTRAIEANANDAVFYSNRALSYSKMGEYDNSLTDFLQANIIDPECFKYQYLVALIWSRIGNHKLSIDLLSKIITKDSVNSQFVEKLIKEEKLFVKNMEGEFDFDKMNQTVAMSGENKIGDYIGSIRILDTPNHGRGMFASFDIIKGENICIVKAVEFFSAKADTCECKNCRMAVLRSNKQNKTLHPKMIESARKSKLTTVRLVTLCDRSIKNVNIELFSGCGHDFAKNFDSSKYPLDRIVKLANKNLNIELVPLDLAQQLRNVNEKASLSIPPSLTGIWLLPSLSFIY